jgi:glutathione S-transferase
MRLHVFPPSPRATKVMAAVFHLDLECEMRIVDLFRGDQHAPPYAALNPNERMPTLEDGDFVLWESNAILFYLASKKPESGLWPAGARAQADAVRWMEWEAAHLTPACVPMAFERVVKRLAGLGEPDAAEVERGEREFHRVAPVLDAHLRGRRWLVGDAPTVGDFAIGGAFVMAAPARYPLEKYPEIVRWYAGVAALPGWQKALAAAANP